MSTPGCLHLEPTPCSPGLREVLREAVTCRLPIIDKREAIIDKGPRAESGSGSGSGSDSGEPSQ
jgi:hypothetical protein